MKLKTKFKLFHFRKDTTRQNYLVARDYTNIKRRVLADDRANSSVVSTWMVDHPGI